MSDNLKAVVLIVSKPLDKEKVNYWIHDLFAKEKAKILNCKGIFNFIYCDYIYEFQAANETFNLKADEFWESGEERKSVVVLFGDNLDDEIKYLKDFHKCIA